VSFTGRDRAEFRAEAHHLNPIVHVGHDGLTPAVVQTIEQALRTKELVKLQVSRNSEITAKEAAPQLAHQLDAEVIQVIGRTLTLYRHNPALVRKEGDAPPWKR
jgi:RNA-binding protein